MAEGGGRARQLAPKPSAEGAVGCGALFPGMLVSVGPRAQPCCLNIHHVDEWSRVKYHICQGPSALAGIHRSSSSSRPSNVYLVPRAHSQCLKPHISGRRGVPPACCPLHLALSFWISKSVLFQELSWSCGLWLNWWLLVNFLVIVHLEFPSGKWGGVGLLCLPHLQGYKQNTSLMLKAKGFRHESERWLHYLLAV